MLIIVVMMVTVLRSRFNSKSFGSENTYKQHNASRKHLDRARRDGIAASTGAPSGMIVVPEAVPEPEVRCRHRS